MKTNYEKLMKINYEKLLIFYLPFTRGNRSTTEGTFTHQTFGNDYDGTFTHQTFGNNQDGNFTHQTFGNGAPVGGGLFILLSAGLGYAATKKKNTKQEKSTK